MKFLGIDVGTTGVKAAVFSHEGALLGYGMETYGISFPAPAYAEQDGELVWERSKKAVFSAVAQAGGDIEAIAVSAQGDAMLLADENGDLLAPVQLGMDYRGSVQINRLAKARGERALFEKTGMPPHPLNFLAKLLWLAENQPDLLEKAQKVMTYADYFMLRFCGEARLDATMAGRTMAVDLKTGDWDDTLLGEASLTEEKLSRICPSGTAVGVIRRELAKELGISPRAVMVCGGHDQVCAAVGAGLWKEGMALDSHGTAEVLSAVLPAPILTDRMLEEGIPCYPHGVHGKYFGFGLNHTGGVGLQWLKGLFGYTSFEELMGSLPSEPTDLLTVPSFLSGGIVSGLALSTSREALCKSLLEGLGFEMRRFLELFQSFGVPIEELRCVGGGAGSPVGLQLKADIYGRPISTLRVREAACLGAALLAAAGAGAYESVEAAIGRTVATDRTFEPDGKRTERYAEAYERYLTLRKINKEDLF